MPLLSIPAEPGDTVLCRLGGSPDQIGLVKQVQAFGRDQFIVFLLGGLGYEAFKFLGFESISAGIATQSILILIVFGLLQTILREFS